MKKPDKKQNLILAVSFLLIAGFLVTSLAGFFVARTSLRTEIKGEELPITSDSIYIEIKKDLQKPVLISAMMAQDSFFRTWAINDEKDVDQVTRYLAGIQERFGTFTAFFVSDKTGTYYYPGGVLKKVSESEERDAWYFRLRGLTGDYEINIDPDLAHKDAMTVFINYRVYDFNGDYIGATGVGLKQSSVRQLIDQYQKKYKKSIYLVDSAGDQVLAGSDTSIEYYGIKNLSGWRSKEADQMYTVEKGSNVFHINIRYLEEFDWYLVVEQSETETIRPILETLLLNIGICIVVTLITLLLVSFSISAYEKKIETLRGIVPICSFCHQIRDDKGFWNRVEAYVEAHTEARFSHSICPSCLEKNYPES